YYVTIDGRIYSMKRDMFINGYDNGIGYKIVSMRVRYSFDDLQSLPEGPIRPRDKSKQKSIHRLVALAWVPRANNQLIEVNHKDLNKANNVPENLEWSTRNLNLAHFAATPQGQAWSKRFRARGKAY